MLNRLTVAAGVITIVCLAMCGCGDDSGVTLNDPVEVTRDAKGVWFISGGQGSSYYDIFEAQGYAVATDRLVQAETFRRSARGRLAEIFGASQLETDIYMRITGFSDGELEAAFNSLDPECQEVVNGYVAGFNRRIAEIRNDPTLLPYEFDLVGKLQGAPFLY
jgi:penicillin amidase